MPVTYNGIGTHYYGKKNLEKRPGPCPHCNRAVELTSYDTRLWFVIFFIPVFPLGRKTPARLLPGLHAPLCRRRAKMGDGKATRNLGGGGRIPRQSHSRRSDRGPPAAPEVSSNGGRPLNFRRKWPSNTQQREGAGLPWGRARTLWPARRGDGLISPGRSNCGPIFQRRALAWPEATFGAGKLDEARALLDFMEKQGAAQLYSLQPLETLALAYQKANRHVEAPRSCSIGCKPSCRTLPRSKPSATWSRNQRPRWVRRNRCCRSRSLAGKRFFSIDRSASRSTSPRVTTGVRSPFWA